MANFHALALAEPTDSGQLSAPFPILYTGDFKRKDFGDIKVTEADLDQAVQNFAHFPSEGVPVDLDHSFAKGGTSEAVGWIKRLFREGKNLMAQVQWTQDAANMIREGRFRLFSPEFSTDWTDESGTKRGLAVLAGGLSNRPFLKSLPPVALSEDAQELVAAETRRLADLSGLDVSVEKAGDKQSGMADKPEKKDKPEPQPAEGVTLTEDQHKTLVEGAEKAEALSEQVTALSERLDETTKDLSKERFAADFSKAQREGRVDAKDETRTKWSERYEKLGRDTAKELLFEMPAETIPVSERGHGADKPAETSVPEGVDPDAHALDERIKARAEEKSITYSEAYGEIADELKAAV